MNRCDDRADPLFATGVSERDRSHCLRAIEEEFVAGKGASEGAIEFMNYSGWMGCTSCACAVFSVESAALYTSFHPMCLLLFQ